MHCNALEQPHYSMTVDSSFYCVYSNPIKPDSDYLIDLISLCCETECSSCCHQAVCHLNQRQWLIAWTIELLLFIINYYKYP